jgi:hypothetical protein
METNNDVEFTLEFCTNTTPINKNYVYTTLVGYRLSMASSKHDGVTFKLPTVPKLNETSVLMLDSVKPKVRNGFPVGCYLSFIDDQVHGTFKNGKFEVFLVPANRKTMLDSKQEELKNLYLLAVEHAVNQ